MPEKPENRVERIVNDLLRGRRLRLRAGDAEEKEAITAAARFVAARHGPQRMTPAFRRRLAQTLESPPRETWLTRRAAIVAGLGVAAGALAGGVVGKTLAPAGAPTPPATSLPTSGPVLPKNPRWTDVGSLTDFIEGQGKLVKAGAVGAFVFRHGDTVTAVSSMCSHLPCELWWDGGPSVLKCPCHPAAFTPDGKPSPPSYTLPALHEVKVRLTADARVEVLGT